MKLFSVPRSRHWTHTQPGTKGIKGRRCIKLGRVTDPYHW